MTNKGHGVSDGTTRRLAERFPTARTASIASQRTLGVCMPSREPPSQLYLCPYDALVNERNAISSHLTFGNFVAQRVLGHGGTGIVYECLDVRTHQRVALKTPLPNRRGASDALRREIAALIRLGQAGSRGVVRLVEAGTSAGVPWYAMEFISPNSLRSFIRRLWTHAPVDDGDASPTADWTAERPVTSSRLEDASVSVSVQPVTGRPYAAAGKLEVVLALAVSIARSLRDLHAQGVVHGDITPANILLREPDRQPVLVDFGTAFQPFHPGTMRENEDAREGSVGTPGFMAPEQIRGEAIDPRADLYAFGCVLYELLTGRPPFVADSALGLQQQHLWHEPILASRHVVGLDQPLDTLILGLLEKEPHRRISRADAVLAVLPSDFTSSTTDRLDERAMLCKTLYRPRFIGRERELAEVIARLDRVAAGAGAFVVAAGESGIGKTRFLKSIAAAAELRGVQVVSCACQSTDSGGESNPLGHGLDTFSSVVRAVIAAGISACELHNSVRDQLSVLLPYAGEMVRELCLSPPESLTSESAGRARVLNSLAQVARQLFAGRPTLIAIDDLQWADELTHEFLCAHTGELTSGSVLVVAAYRSEAQNERTAQLSALATHVVALRRLDLAATYSITADMLAAPRAPDGLPEYLLRQSEGNPFLIAEYLRAAVACGNAHYRPPSWHFEEPALTHEAGLMAMPSSVHKLFELRCQSLSPAAIEFLEHAAVIGREFDRGVVASLAGFTGESATSAAEELVVQHVVEYLGAGRYRFAHDKLRETQERALPEVRRRVLHRRAAENTQELATRHTLSIEQEAQLGIHWAEAGDSRRALEQLCRAARASMKIYAHSRASELYGLAIRQRQELATQAASDSLPTLAELCEELADALVAQASHVGARAAYEQALESFDCSARLERARVLRKLAASYWTVDLHELADTSLASAEALLGTPGADDPSELHCEYIEVQLGRFERLYFSRRSVSDSQRILEALRTTVECHGRPGQRVRYYLCTASHTMARARYAYTPEAVELARRCLEAERSALSLEERALSHFIVGFALALGDESQCQEALVHLELAARGAERAGDRTLQSRVMAYLSLAQLRLRNLDALESTAKRAEECADAAKLPMYAAVARGNRAWLMWRRGHLAEAARLAKEAMAIWREYKINYPFRWCVSMVALDLALYEQDFPRALEAIEDLLHPTQQCLPGELTALLASAAEHCRAERYSAAAGEIAAIMKTADSLRYC